MKTLLFKICLLGGTEQAFQELIDRSLANYYFGASMPHCGPVDADRARTLLFELWVGLVREDVLWSASAQFWTGMQRMTKPETRAQQWQRSTAISKPFHYSI
jgi:hypothetical protein